MWRKSSSESCGESIASARKCRGESARKSSGEVVGKILSGRESSCESGGKSIRECGGEGSVRVLERIVVTVVGRIR